MTKRHFFVKTKLLFSISRFSRFFLVFADFLFSSFFRIFCQITNPLFFVKTKSSFLHFQFHEFYKFSRFSVKWQNSVFSWNKSCHFFNFTNFQLFTSFIRIFCLMTKHNFFFVKSRVIFFLFDGLLTYPTYFPLKNIMLANLTIFQLFLFRYCIWSKAVAVCEWQLSQNKLWIRCL